nr:hypothetical protein [Tanacetum cinerariifolium]
MSSSSSSSHAIVMYTSISSDDDLPLWGISLMDAYELEAPEAAPQSPDQALLSVVHASVYPKYLTSSDNDITPAEDQPLPASALPTTLSSNYSADSKPIEEDLKEDLEEDLKEDLEEDPEEDLEQEPSEEEKELSTPADSPPAGLYIDLPFKVEEDKVPSSPPSPTSHRNIIPLS